MRKWPVAAGAVVVAFSGLWLVLISRQTLLIVRSSKTSELKYCTRMADGDEFIIEYTHSVNRRPVYDTLRIEGRGMRIVKSRFDAFGAGIPETSSADHPLRFAPDGWLEYTVDRSVPEVTVFVGRVAQHTLHVQGRSIPLADLNAPGTAVRFSVERHSLLAAWMRRAECIHE